MVNPRVLNRSAWTLSILLLLCAPKFLWGAPPNTDIRVAGKVIEVSGTGRTPWKLRYALAGTAPSGKGDETHLVRVGSGQAYFSHGQCLRRIDTDSGIVLGRWFMPGIVTRIAPEGPDGKAEITVEEPSPGRTSSTSTFVFDPLHPRVPIVLSHESTLENLLPEREAVNLYGEQTLLADRARALLPEVREAVRRDPFSPWFGVILGKLLLEAGEPGADAALEQRSSH